MTRLSDREQRMIAILILVALVAFGWLAVISPIIDGFEARAAERERLALVQASNQRLIDNVARLRRQAEAQKADMARYHLIAPTPDAAAEGLKDRVAALLAEAGGEVRAMQPCRTSKPRKGVSRSGPKHELTEPSWCVCLNGCRMPNPF
jgi:type II secretory pathway component PulM